MIQRMRSAVISTLASAFTLSCVFLNGNLAQANEGYSFYCWSAPDRNHVEKFVEIDQTAAGFQLHTGVRVNGETRPNPIRHVECTLDGDHFQMLTPVCHEADVHFTFSMRTPAPNETVYGLPYNFQSSNPALSASNINCQLGE